MLTDPIVIRNIQEWLVANHRTQSWLAKEMDIAKSLLSQILSQKRKLQPQHLLTLAQITGMTVAQLTGHDNETDQSPQYTVRGKCTTTLAQQNIEEILADVAHCVDLGEVSYD